MSARPPLPLLRAPEPLGRRRAALALLAVAALLGACERADDGVRVRLRASDPAVRRAAAQTLAEGGPASAEAVPELLAVLDDAELGLVPLWALGEIGPAAAAATERLLALTTSDDGPRRAVALWALARIAPQASEVRQAIERACTADVALVRQAARGAMRSLPPR